MVAMPGREIRSLFSSAFSVVSLNVIFMADSLDGELDFLEDMVGKQVRNGNNPIGSQVARK
jgi:hypothetical protein